MNIRDVFQAWISVVDDHIFFPSASLAAGPVKNAWAPAVGDYFIQLSVQHEGSKHRPEPGVYAYAFLCRRNGGGGSVSLDILRVADMPRYNLGKCQALAQEVRRQIEGKAGPVWDLVLAMREKHRASTEKAGADPEQPPAP